jgi:hypothetical protein
LIDTYAHALTIGEKAYHPPLDNDTDESVPGDYGRHEHIYLQSSEKWSLVKVREHNVTFGGL